LGLKILDFPFHILNWFNLPFRSRDPQTAVVVVRHS